MSSIDAIMAWTEGHEVDTRYYLKPVSVCGAASFIGATPLGGSPVGCMDVEVIARTPAGKISRRYSPMEGLVALPRLRETLIRYGAPRPVVAGLDVNNGMVIMGVVNVTPDSFSDGGMYHQAKAAIDHARLLMDEGADILDIGGESTRPGALPISAEEQMARILPVIEAVAVEAKERNILISVDTQSAVVMKAAIDAGAHIMNDVSALVGDENSTRLLANSNVPAIIMHMQKQPSIMQQQPNYENVVLDIYDFLAEKIKAAQEQGVTILAADVGIGFGKSLSHNLDLLASIGVFHGLGVPLLLGCSRKSFIGALSGADDSRERLGGSLASALWAAGQGVHIIRVHDVAQTRQALTIWQAIQNPVA
ncbi:MAG: dihydropteroate synthase [Alphaproteobacteria bacterium]